MKSIFFKTLFFACLLTGSLLPTTAQAQSIIWGVPLNHTAVSVDTTGGRLDATWSNRGINGVLDTFSAPRFYHLWIEQKQANNSWQVPVANAHFFVSDTMWVADQSHGLQNTTAPIRLRVAPFKLEFNTTTSSMELTEHPELNRVSMPTLSPTNARHACCIVAIIVDKLAPPVGNPCATNAVTLGYAHTHTNSLPIENAAGQLQTSAAFNSWLTANYANQKLSLEAKERPTCAVAASAATPLIYEQSQTAGVISVTNSAATNMDRLNSELDLLLKAIYNRLAAANYSTAQIDAMTVRMVVP